MTTIPSISNFAGTEVGREPKTARPVDTFPTIASPLERRGDRPRSIEEDRSFYDSLTQFSLNSRIDIALDAASGKPVVKVLDEDGKTVILQVPSELSLRLAEVLPTTVGLLIDRVT